MLETDRRVWIVTPAAAAVLVLGFALRSVFAGPGSDEKQIDDRVYENPNDVNDAFRVICADRGGTLHEA